MNIGDILEIVCPQIGVMRNSYDIAASDEEMRQIRAVVNEAGLDMVSRAPWRRLIAASTIAAGSVAVTLPSAARDENPVVAIIENGRTLPQLRLGAFEVAKQSGAQGWVIMDQSIQFAQPLGNDATLYYVIGYWLDGQKYMATANTDIPLVPVRPLMDSIRVRWLRAKGLPYDTDLAEFQANLQRAIAMEAVEAQEFV